MCEAVINKHAINFAFGAAICVGGLMSLYTQGDFLASCSSGLFALGMAYALVYTFVTAAPYLWSYEPVEYPEPPQVKQTAVIIKHNDEPGLRLADDGNTTIVYRHSINRGHIIKLAHLVCVVGEGKLSQRRLHDAGIADRFKNEHPTPLEIMNWLRNAQLIRPIGNEQFEVTDLLFNSLRPFTPLPQNGNNHVILSGGQERNNLPPA